VDVSHSTGLDRMSPSNTQVRISVGIATVGAGVQSGRGMRIVEEDGST
jgi:hypothetical protein